MCGQPANGFFPGNARSGVRRAGDSDNLPLGRSEMNGLDPDEREPLEAYEAGKLKPVPNAADLQKRHREYAEAVFRKDARINIRLSSSDLRGLQKKALAEGIPYQTLVASILHKYVEGRLREDR
jgi:predicted DNA binding CopG/RHH family protein